MYKVEKNSPNNMVAIPRLIIVYTLIFDTDDHHIKLCVFVNVQGNAIPTWQKSFFTIHSIDSLR